jgi:RNA polymerase sigma-70 factor (ECF subfamily)
MPGHSLDDSRSAAARLYDAYGTALYRYAVLVLADARDAEDVIQQVFVRLLRLDDMPATPEAYLRRAVRNECYSRLRRRSSQRKTGQEDALLEVAAEGTSPEERLALERALRALPAEQREVVHLHVYEGWTFREVSELTATSINTVAARYRYALATLRRLLAASPTEDP